VPLRPEQPAINVARGCGQAFGALLESQVSQGGSRKTHGRHEEQKLSQQLVVLFIWLEAKRGTENFLDEVRLISERARDSTPFILAPVPLHASPNSGRT
jgi:hypothetical protein